METTVYLRLQNSNREQELFCALSSDVLFQVYTDYACTYYPEVNKFIISTGDEAKYNKAHKALLENSCPYGNCVFADNVCLCDRCSDDWEIELGV